MLDTFEFLQFHFHRAEKSSMVQVALSVFNILICALMIYLGVAGIMQITFGAGFNELSELFVIIYMFVFSALLLTYEAMWWKSINSINRVLRKNFGFMYGLKGKAGFLVFVAFLCLGLEGITNLEVLMYATGSLWLVGKSSVYLLTAKHVLRYIPNGNTPEKCIQLTTHHNKYLLNCFRL